MRTLAALGVLFFFTLCVSTSAGYRFFRQPLEAITERETRTPDFSTGGAPGTPKPGSPGLSGPQELYFPAVSLYPVIPFTFIAWADTKYGLPELAELSNQAAEFQPAFTLFPGDLESDGFTQEGMIEWLKAMSGGRGNGMNEIVFPVRGNHDALEPEGWQNFFHLDMRAVALGLQHYSSLDDDLTYSFDYSNAHFVGIDVPGAIETITPRQIEFLDRDLSAAEERRLAHAFLFFHGPIYPVGHHSTCKQRVCATAPVVLELVELLNRHPIVAAVFTGHEHLQAYVHIDDSRIPEITQPFEQVISGAAGAELHECLYPERADFCESYTGFTVVRVDGANFEVRYYRIGKPEPVRIYNFQN